MKFEMPKREDECRKLASCLQYKRTAYDVKRLMPLRHFPRLYWNQCQQNRLQIGGYAPGMEHQQEAKQAHKEGKSGLPNKYIWTVIAERSWTCQWLFTKSVVQNTYRLIKELSQIDEDMASVLQRMDRKTEVQIKGCNFTEKNKMSAIAILHDFKPIWKASSIYKGASAGLSTQHLAGSTEAAVKYQIELSNFLSNRQYSALGICFENFQFFIMS